MVSEQKVTKNQGQKNSCDSKVNKKKSYRTEKRTAWKKQEPVTKKSGESGKPGISLTFFTSWKISTYLSGPKTCVSPLEIFLGLLSPHLYKSLQTGQLFLLQDGIVVVFYYYFIYPTMLPHRQHLIRLRWESICLFSPKRQAVCDQALCHSQAFPRPL